MKNYEQYDEAKISEMKKEGTALELLNKALREVNEKGSQTKVFTVRLNKDLAEFLLKFNLKTETVSNRPINWGVVQSMARQMLHGHFRNTGEPLLFTDQADGIDLQHRCHAVLAAAQINPAVSYETTVVTGLHVENIESLVDRLLVMGTSRRTKLNLAHFANVDPRLWEMVEYYMLPDDIRPGRINKALSKLEINDEYKAKRQHYDETFAKISEMFNEHKEVNAELGEKRLPLYAAAALKMMDESTEKAMEFMQAFFNPLENTLPKGNAVDAVRGELVEAFVEADRDKTRPIYVRRAMILAFQQFVAGKIKTKWRPFIGFVEKKAPGRKAKEAKEAAPEVPVETPVETAAPSETRAA